MRWAQSRSLPAGDVFWARLILAALADGMTYEAIKGSLHTTAPDDLTLEAAVRTNGPGWPRTPTQGQQTSDSNASGSGEDMPQGATETWGWQHPLVGPQASRRDGREQIERASNPIPSQADPQPHRLQHYMTSNDPDFEAKAADIIGLYCSCRSMQPCFAWMRRPRFRRSIAWTRSCRCRLDERSDTGSNITDMEPYRCTRHWM